MPINVMKIFRTIYNEGGGITPQNVGCVIIFLIYLAVVFVLLFLNASKLSNFDNYWQSISLFKKLFFIPAVLFGGFLILWAIIIAIGGTIEGISSPCRLRLLDIKTGKKLKKLRGLRWGNFSVISIAFSPDGKEMATGTENHIKDNHIIYLWDLTSGKIIRKFTGHTEKVEFVVFSPDGATLASRGRDAVRLWEKATGREILTISRDHYISYMDLSQDGKKLALATDKTICIYMTGELEEILRIVDHNYIRSVAFSPDSRRLASGGDGKDVCLWEADTGKELFRIKVGDIITHVTFSPDGTRLAGGGFEKVIQIWDPKTGDEICSIDEDQRIGKLLFSPDGRVLASRASYSSTLRFWDVETGEELQKIEKVKSPFAFSPDGKKLATP